MSLFLLLKFWLKKYFSRVEFVLLNHKSNKSVSIFCREDHSVFNLCYRNETDIGVIKQCFRDLEYWHHRKNINDHIQAKYGEICRSTNKPLIVDLGANIGCVSCMFATKFPASKVLGVEPDPGNFELAQKNVLGFENITLIEGAVGERSGFCNIADREVRSDSFQVTGDPNGSIQVYTVDELLRLQKNVTLFIVKIDIEGGEEFLFSDNLDWVRGCFLIIIELHDWMDLSRRSSTNFLRALAESGRSCILGNNVIFSFGSV